MSENLPLNAEVFSAPLFLISDATNLSAVSQLVASNLLSILIYGLSKRCLDKPSIANLVLSLIHSSLISSFNLGKTLSTFFPLESILILAPMPSKTSTDSVFFNSQGLD